MTMLGKKAVSLDTNIVVDYLRDPGLHDFNLATHRPYLSVTALAELYAGAAKSARPDRNRKGIETFLKICTLLPNDAVTAKIYGDLWSELAKTGQMIPTNDIWIAASAIQHRIPLISQDPHLKRISRLEVQTW